MSYLTYTQPTKGDHPRLFISDTHGPTMAEMATRIAMSPWSIYWGSGTNSVVGWTTAHVGDADSYFNSASERCGAMALRYLLTGTGAYGSKCASVGTYLAGLGGSTETVDRENLFAMALIYDWAYDYLSTSQRSTLRSAIYSLASSRSTPKDDEKFYGHSELNCLIGMIGYAAIMNDSDDSGQNTLWRTKFEEALDGWEDGTNNSFSAAHSYYGDTDGGTFKGAGPWCYLMTAKQWHPRFFAAMESALDLDIYAQNPWYHKLIEWLVWHLGRRDSIGHRDGEQVGASLFPIYGQAYFYHVASKEDNWLGSAAMWLVQEQDRVNKDALWGPWQIFRVLWASLMSGTIPTLSTANSGNQMRQFAVAKKTCFRTGFNSTTDTSFVIAAPPFEGGHTQRGPGHWSLESRGDVLFCRHGHYDGNQLTTYRNDVTPSLTESGHRYTYYAQQIAKSCLRIYDSNEPAENLVESHQRYFSASTFFGIRKSTGTWISNQGGCLWPKSATHTYPWSLADLLATPEWIPETLAYTAPENSKYCYVVYDLHDCYYSGKVTRYKLHVMWIKQRQIDPDWNDPLILLWYDCTSHIDSDTTKGGRKTQTIQLQTQAQMTGSAALLQIARSNSKCWVKTYTPSVVAEFVSGYRDLDGNVYQPSRTYGYDDSTYPAGSAPWRTEIYPLVASTNPSFLLALAPAALTANVADVPFGTLIDDASWRGIQFGNYIFKMAKGDTHSAVYEDVSTPIPEPEPPTPPFALVAQAYDSNVNLVWQQTEAVMNHWHIFRRTKLGVGVYTTWAQIGSNTLKQYNDGTVVNGTTYQYAVTAIDDADQESMYSNLSAEVTPTALVPPPPPPPPIVDLPALNQTRRSAGVSLSMSVLPCPDGLSLRQDLPHQSWLYAGIRIAAPAVDYSLGADISTPVAIDGADIAGATAIEGEDLSCVRTPLEGETI